MLHRFRTVGAFVALVALLCASFTQPASAVGPITTQGVRFSSSSSSSSGGGGGSSYTATHYVTTTASGSGDGSIGNPWTMAQAVSTASGSNKVRVAPGVYTFTPIGSANSPRFEVTHDGTDATEAGRLVFFCQYPGAYNRATPANQCELRSNNPAVLGAAIGCGPGIDHVVFDGFTIDQAYTMPRPSTGTVFCGGGQSGTVATDISIRRFYFKNVEQPSGDNYAAIIGVKITGFYIQDNWFEGGSGDGEGDCGTMYGVHDFIIEHNTLDGTRMGFYAKGSTDSATRWNYGVMRFNWAEDVDNKVFFASEVQTAQFVDIYQNICLRSHACIRGDPAGVGPSRVRAFNNTIVDTILDPVGSAQGQAAAWFDGAVAGTGNAFYNNIVAQLSTTTNVALVMAQVSNLPNYFNPIDYNTYYNNGSTLYFATNQDDALPGDGIQLAAWQTATSDESHSNGRNPLFVSSSDFHLQGGSSELTAGNTGGPRGAYITGSEEPGIRASPSY